MNIFEFSKPSVLLLHYGLFAVLCQVCGIFLFSTTLPSPSTALYCHTLFPMLEHSMLSAIIIFVGVLGLEYISKDIDKDRLK
jgi:hypothetical protein